MRSTPSPARRRSPWSWEPTTRSSDGWPLDPIGCDERGRLMGVVETVGAYAAAVAAIGLAPVLPLFVSQRRDLRRLHEWMDADPEHPVADLAASERILDRAEAELERLEGPPTTEPTTEPPARVTPLPP